MASPTTTYVMTGHNGDEAADLIIDRVETMR